MDDRFKGCVLVVDDEVNIRNALQRMLSQFEFKVLTASNARDAREVLEREQVDAALIDYNMPETNGLELLKWIRAQGHQTTPLIMTAAPTYDRAVEVMREGAYDFLPKPLPADHRIIVQILRRAVERTQLQRHVHALSSRMTRVADFEEMIGSSPVMLGLYQKIRNYGPTNANILILGEPGVGKESVAKALHKLSFRKDRPFSAVSCPLLSNETFHSEVFGHKKGAFTGALQDRAGMVETLDGGTLFLDEFGDLSLANQAKLLRYIESGEFAWMGEPERIRRSNVRIVAATNKQLQIESEAGRFRPDLLSRFAFTIVVPPLRQRKEDIPDLVQAFLRKHAEAEQRQISGVSPDALDALRRCDWSRANVRDLSNAVHHAVITCGRGEISLEHLPSDVFEDLGAVVETHPSSYPYVPELAQKTYMAAKKEAEFHFARYYFGLLLTKHNGTVNKAAGDAGMEASNLRKKLREIGLDAAAFRTAGASSDGEESDD